MGSSRQHDFDSVVPRWREEWPELFEVAERQGWKFEDETANVWPSLVLGSLRDSVMYRLAIREWPTVYLLIDMVDESSKRPMNASDESDRAVIMMILLAEGRGHGPHDGS